MREKLILALCLGTAMLSGLCGCGNGEEKAAAGIPSPPEEAQARPEEDVPDAAATAENFSGAGPGPYGDAFPPASEGMVSEPARVASAGAELRLTVAGDGRLFRRMKGSVVHEGKRLTVKTCYGPVWHQGMVHFVLFPFELTERERGAVRNADFDIAPLRVVGYRETPNPELWPESCPWVTLALKFATSASPGPEGATPATRIRGSGLQSVVLNLHNWTGIANQGATASTTLPAQQLSVAAFSAPLLLSDLADSGLTVARFQATTPAGATLDLRTTPGTGPEAQAKAQLTGVEVGPVETATRRPAPPAEKREVNPKNVAEALGLEYPVPEPTHSLEEIKKAAKAAARRETLEEFPPKGGGYFLKQAQQQIPQWNEGDKVSFVIRGGRGPNTAVEGRLGTVTNQRVQVGSRWVARDDISENVLARLDPEVRKERVQAIAHRNREQWKTERQEHYKERYLAHCRDLMKESNYVHRKDQWISAKELFKKALARRWQPPRE